MLWHDNMCKYTHIYTKNDVIYISIIKRKFVCVQYKKIDALLATDKETRMDNKAARGNLGVMDVSIVLNVFMVYTGVVMCQNLSDSTHKTCALYFMWAINL